MLCFFYVGVDVRACDEKQGIRHNVDLLVGRTAHREMERRADEATGTALMKAILGDVVIVGWTTKLDRLGENN